MMSRKFFRYKAFERIFSSTEDTQETISRVEEKIKYHNPRAFEEKSSTTLKWVSTDSEEEYQKNISKRKSELEKYGWVDQEIDYNLNQYGFRDEEFYESPDSIVATGECFTFGTGLLQSQLWPTMLSEKLAVKVWNLGLPTAPLDVMFRALYAWLPVIKPRMVLLLENSQLGREIFTEENAEPIGFWSPEQWKQDLAADKVERYISRQKNLMAISELCQQHQVELKTISAVERHEIGMKAWKENENEKYAASRDLMHPGLHFQQELTNRWLEEF